MQHDAVTTGTTVIQLLHTGRFAGIHELLPPALRELVSAEALRDSWQGLIATHGPVTQVGTPLSEAAGPSTTIVKLPVTCARGAFAVLMVIDQGGAIWQVCSSLRRRRPSRWHPGNRRPM